jgi:hypothetical protein
MRRSALGFLALWALALACLGSAASAAGAAGERHVILACYTANPQDVIVDPPGDDTPREDALLHYFQREPGLSAGLWSSVHGVYSAQQSLLDVSQGTRQPSGLYGAVDVNNDDRIDDLHFDSATRSFTNWGAFRQRAHDVSRTIRPGLLAGSIPGGAGFVGAAGEPVLPAIAAADERGHVAATSIGSVETLVARARAMSRSERLVVVGVPFGRAGRAQLSALARDRPRDELVIIVQLADTPDRDALVRPPVRLLRQAAIAVGAGYRGSPTSATTRQAGLVSSIDVAPSVLRWIGVQPPDRMRGVEIEDGPRVDADRLDALRTRWTRMRDGRQVQSFMAIVTLAAILFLLLGTWRDIRFAVGPTLRISALGALWWPSAILLAGAVEPATRVTEVFLIAGVSVVLGAVTERLLPWARAPILPAAVCLAAYTIDLALGGDLLTRSALGPSIASGGRFYGVTNELEPILPIVLLVGLAAATTGRKVTRATMVLYALAGLALLFVVGWGRLGADVGGVITIGAGVAVAMLVISPGAITTRRVVATALVPVAALALLIVIDLVLSGGSHLTRNLLRADDAGELVELVTRRYQLAWRVLTSGDKPALFSASVLAVAFAWRNRARLYGGLTDRAWGAALLGGLAAGVAGALANDSGPVLLVNAVFGLVALTAYLLGRPAEQQREA